MHLPAAWRNNEAMSQRMKKRGYDSGLIREFWGPNVMTIRDSVRHIPAAMKTGAMVRQMMCMRKLGCSNISKAQLDNDHDTGDGLTGRGFSYLENGL